MENQANSAEVSFRDRITTVDDRGKRRWLFPKRPKGRLYTYRIWLSYLLLLIFFLTPWLRIDGEPVMMLDVIRRKFVLFGQIFWPQDFHLFVLMMILLIVFIVAFTVVYGRIFCGWLCPQTIFMEMVYRRIEYWIEGDSRAQRALREEPWTLRKVWKRSLKYALFYLLAVLISYTFLAYIIGTDRLMETLASPLSERLGGFIAILIFSLVFFLIYAWFREQVCLIVCPYGRLQGVMLDRNSVVVAYDYIRGEGSSGRARFRSGEDRKALGKGDCIDCSQCVDVCPTGIDIRNGVQLECINCT
ncbi:MAG TPA: 4Fe-4S binding protein, partial [Bacteroidales bacterium]|nr:4Fe-4S binding protein [Bacteroidales bacterium]